MELSQQDQSRDDHGEPNHQTKTHDPLGCTRKYYGLQYRYLAVDKTVTTRDALANPYAVQFDNLHDPLPTLLGSLLLIYPLQFSSE
jgi:hypothetical protein